MRGAAAVQAWTARTGSTVGAGIVAAELAVMYVGATLPSPLYPLYRHAFGFGGVTLTLVYAVYVLGNVVALLVFGRLSDQVGRRTVILPAMGVALASTVVFLLAEGTGWLFLARVLSGFSTGLAAGTTTAWIVELLSHAGKSVAARVAAIANFVGLAIGPLLTGLVAELSPWPLRLPYALYIVILVAMAVAIVLAPETVRREGKQISLRPRLGVPRGLRLQFIAPAVTGFVTFALLGFYAALIPSLLGQNLHHPEPIVAGGVVFELFLIAAATVIATTRVTSQKAMLAGLATFVPCVALLVLAQVLESMWLLLLATAMAGIAGALGYRGSLEVVNLIAPGNQRSEVTSSYLLAMYIGNSIPVIGVGLLTSLSGSLVAHMVFAIVLAGLSVAAIIVGLRYDPSRR